MTGGYTEAGIAISDLRMKKPRPRVTQWLNCWAATRIMGSWFIVLPPFLNTSWLFLLLDGDVWISLSLYLCLYRQIFTYIMHVYILCSFIYLLKYLTYTIYKILSLKDLQSREKMEKLSACSSENSEWPAFRGNQPWGDRGVGGSSSSTSASLYNYSCASFLR